MGLQERHPRLVIASIGGFGQTGPARARPGHDLGYCALAGTLATGARAPRGGAPSLPGVQLADIAGGALTGAFAIAAALFARERTGRGDWIDLSMTDAVLPFVLPAIAQHVQGVPVRPGDNLLTGKSPSYQLYTCADGGIIAFAPLEPQFQAIARPVLAEVSGGEVAWTTDGLAAAFRLLPRDAWVERLGMACVEPLLELDEVTPPTHRSRGTIRGESRARVAPPLPGPRGFVDAPAPALRADTAAALRAVGYDADQLNRED